MIRGTSPQNPRIRGKVTTTPAHIEWLLTCPLCGGPGRTGTRPSHTTHTRVMELLGAQAIDGLALFETQGTWTFGDGSVSEP